MPARATPPYFSERWPCPRALPRYIPSTFGLASPLSHCIPCQHSGMRALCPVRAHMSRQSLGGLGADCPQTPLLSRHLLSFGAALVVARSRTAAPSLSCGRRGAGCRYAAKGAPPYSAPPPSAPLRGYARYARFGVAARSRARHGFLFSRRGRSRGFLPRLQCRVAALEKWGGCGHAATTHTTAGVPTRVTRACTRAHATFSRRCLDVDLDTLGKICLLPHMAKIRFSSVVSGARGSIGGTVFSRNRGGAYIRNRTTPIDPSTILQNAARSVFRDAVSAWVDVLTDGQRNAWYSYAFQTPYTDSLGETRNYTAQQAFIKAYCALVPLGVPVSSFAGAPSTTELPALPDFDDVNPGIDSFVPSLPLLLGKSTAGAAPINIPAPEGITAGALLLWAVAAPRSPAANSPHIPYRNVGAITAVDVGGGNIGWEYTGFADPWAADRVVGDKLHYRYRVLTPDGRMSAWVSIAEPLLNYDTE